MKYTAEFDTNIGAIRAVWNGREHIQLFPHGSDTATSTINVWDYANDKPTVAQNARAMAAYVREWLWEMERGIEFERITYSESSCLDESDEDAE